MHRLLVWVVVSFLLVSGAAIGADIVVYDDTSHNPPFDQGCSFGGVASDYIFNNTAPVHSGSDSIRFIPEQYNAVSWCGNTTYSTATYSGIRFWVYLSSAAQGDNVDFVLSTLNTVHGAASLNTIYGAAIPVGAWTQLHTSFAGAPLNYSGSFDHISFQDETGNTNYDIFGNGFDAPTPSVNVYFDDVVLQSAATITYTVTAGAGSNGSISPASQIVPSGSTATFTVTPNAGYHVTSVTGDHCTITQQGATTTWISSAITQACAVTAAFAINTYTVTPSAGSGGSLTPNTPQTVNYNATKNFTVAANVGYHVVSVTGCGGVLNASTYTTGPITADCTVTATFAADTPACGLLVEKHDQSVTPATGDTMISDVFDWCDSAGNPREAVLAHNDQTGKQAAGGYPNHGGSLQQFTYQLPGGATRTATITTYGNGGYGGFGYVVSHSQWLSDGYCSGDDSPLGYAFSGTWTRVFEGRHHAIFRFQQNYQRHCGPTNPAPTTLVPVTIDWVFSTGRDNPVWAITYDMSGIAQNFLYDDSRAPYGELNIDGVGSTDIDGTAWGDKYKFTSTTAPVTLSSAWTWNVVNTVPYVKEWIAANHGDATMGIVQTQTLAQQDAGGSRNPYYEDNTAYWGKTSGAGNACPSGGYAMPCQDNWPYQANNDSIGVGVSNNNARLTWGTQYGFLGQTSYASNQTTAPDPDNGPYLSGWPKKSYSTYIVLGAHSTSPVETQVTQVETVQKLTLSATTGNVVTTGPAGVNRSDTITYAPAGYDQIYGALVFNAASNVLDANIAVASGTLQKPLIIVHNYTGASYPTSVKLNGTALTMDTDYFPSLRGNSTNELWITLNRDLTGATNHLQINTASGSPAHWVDGYYVGYQSAAMPVNQVPFGEITHLMIGAILPNADGSLDQTFYIDAVNGPAWAQSAVTAAHNAGSKAILMIGGAGSIAGWQGAASNANRGAFVTNLLNAVDTYGADGLDLDWEPIDATNDGAALTALVQALRNARAGLILTMPVGVYNQNFAPGPGSDDANLFATLYPLLDQINIMSYGQAYDASGWYSWFSSALSGEQGNYPIDISSSAADYEAFGVPAAKLGVGIGAYGICFQNVNQPRVAVNSGDIVSADDNTMTYAHIASAYIPNMTYSYDATAKAPWLAHATAVAPEGCSYITYEDATSITDKGAWVTGHGLGGTIVWTIAEGHLGSGNDPLLDAAHAAFP